MDPILPNGFVYQQSLNGGGQADVHQITAPVGGVIADMGFYSQKNATDTLPNQVVVRRVKNVDSLPTRNESAGEARKRVRKLQSLAAEVNACIHFAAGYPFVDVIGMYRAVHPNGQKDLCFIMPLYYKSLWTFPYDSFYLERVAEGRGESVIRVILAQVLAALKKMHTNNFAHRDVTASNILIGEISSPDLIDLRVYVTDFGFSQLSGAPVVHANTEEMGASANNDEMGEPEASSEDEGFAAEGESSPTDSSTGPGSPPHSAYHQTNSKKGPYTCAGTVLFRAPESLFHCADVDSRKLDIWAVGTDLLYCLLKGNIQQFLPFHSSVTEVDQLANIFASVATYDQSYWATTANSQRLLAFTHAQRSHTGQLFTGLRGMVSSECLDALKAMLQPNPNLRPTADELLMMPWFANSPEALALALTIEHQETVVPQQERIDFTNKSEEDCRRYLHTLPEIRAI